MNKACFNCYFENNPNDEQGNLTKPCFECVEYNEFIPKESFYSLYQRGLIIQDKIDDFIDMWHDSEYISVSIYEFLGMSLEQYRLYVDKGVL